jgi:hypothetical protein
MRIDSGRLSTESQGFDGSILPTLKIREENFPFDVEFVGDVVRRMYRGLPKRKLDAEVATICNVSDRTARDILSGKAPPPGELIATIVVALTRRPKS